MSLDDRVTVAALDAARGVFRQEITRHDGRIVDMAGDSILTVFDATTGAVQAALPALRHLERGAKSVHEESQLRFRIGIHLGDVIEKSDGTVYGDGVNNASRLQTLRRASANGGSQACQSEVAEPAVDPEQTYADLSSTPQSGRRATKHHSASFTRTTTKKT